MARTLSAKSMAVARGFRIRRSEESSVDVAADY